MLIQIVKDKLIHVNMSLITPLQAYLFSVFLQDSK